MRVVCVCVFASVLLCFARRMGAFIPGQSGLLHTSRCLWISDADSSTSNILRQKLLNTLSRTIPKGEVIVVKYGGHAMTDEKLQKLFAEDIALLKNHLGLKPVVVHGGGPQIGAMLESLNITSQFIRGLRVTDAKTMEVAQMVLCGQINKEIASLITKQGAAALGFSGKDGDVILATKKLQRFENADGSFAEVDLGLVGEPTRCNAKLLRSIMDADIVPVIAPVGVTLDGQSLNINADTAAGAVAAALQAKALLLLTDVAGVLDDKKQLINQIRSDEVVQMAMEGTITGGMIPKLETAAKAVQTGVETALIVDGRLPHCVLRNLIPERESGTAVTLTGKGYYVESAEEEVE